MNLIRTGILCLGVCVALCAQGPSSDDLQQIDPTTGKPVAAPSAPRPAAPQTPAQPAQPEAAPQQAPPRLSPEAPPEQPLQQQAPTGPTITAAPELPKYPDVRMPGETGWSVGLDLWAPQQQPIFDRGRGSYFPQSSYVVMQGTPKYSPGADIGIAMGLHNALRLSYFSARAAGNFTNSQDLTLWNQTYSAGTLMSTNYNVQNLKISFDYLTWPYPVESRRFRLLTLWQLQYTSIRAAFDAPQLPLVDSSGSPLIDASGNPVSYAGTGSKWFLSPTFGLGAHEYVNKHLRVEVNGDGFAIPHHWTIWDVDATLNIRMGHVEFRGGFKAFHYKTSTNADFYLRGDMFSPLVALRWYSD